MRASFLTKALRFAQWLVYAACFVVFTLWVPWVRKRVFGASWAGIWEDCRRYSRWGFAIFGVRWRGVISPEVQPGKPYILVANHRSWFDQVLVIAAFPVPVHFIAKKEYFDMPIVGPAMALMEVYPVDRGHPNPETFARVREALARGECVLFYAEGTRASGREFLPFHSGAFRLAAETGVPVLPTYILGTEEIWSKKDRFWDIKKGLARLVVKAPVIIGEQSWRRDMREFESSFKQEYENLHDGRAP